MRNKKLISGILAGVMTIALSCTAAIADNTLSESGIVADTDSPYFMEEEPDYISFDEYLNKYGEENVISGFKQAEAENKAELLRINGETEAAIADASVGLGSDEPNELFTALSGGEFLGLKVLGVSDLPPDDVRLTVRLERDSEPIDADANVSNTQTPQQLMSSSSLKNKTWNDCTIYYTSHEPDNSELKDRYESESGAYMYKVSIGYTHNYMYSTTIDFSGAKLKRGTQNTNMYTFIAALSGDVFELGFIANPSDSSRNAGMYPYCTDRSKDSGMDAEAYPKVYGSCSNNTMTFGTVNPVTVQLSIGEDGMLYMYMSINGNMVFYREKEDSGFVSSATDSNNHLAFMQAMSCVGAEEGASTNTSSGSYFKNVTFSDSAIYSYTNGTCAFPMYGDYTYYTMLCKPQYLDFSYTSNSETLSISYE